MMKKIMSLDFSKLNSLFCETIFVSFMFMSTCLSP